MGVHSKARHRKAMPMMAIVMTKETRRRVAAVAGSGIALTMIAGASGAVAVNHPQSKNAIDVSALTKKAAKTVSANAAVVSSDVAWQTSDDVASTVVSTTPKAPARPAVAHTSSAAASAASLSVSLPASDSRVVSIAQHYLGVPYVWGGTSPSGFDCSGLVQYVFNQIGIHLPRTSYAQGAAGQRIPASAAQPGDLVYYGGHIGIYVGGGKMIHAPKPGESVKVAKVWGSPSYVRVS